MKTLWKVRPVKALTENILSSMPMWFYEIRNAFKTAVCLSSVFPARFSPLNKHDLPVVNKRAHEFIRIIKVAKEKEYEDAFIGFRPQTQTVVPFISSL